MATEIVGAPDSIELHRWVIHPPLVNVSLRRVGSAYVVEATADTAQGPWRLAARVPVASARAAAARWALTARRAVGPQGVPQALATARTELAAASGCACTGGLFGDIVGGVAGGLAGAAVSLIPGAGPVLAPIVGVGVGKLVGGLADKGAAPVVSSVSRAAEGAVGTVTRAVGRVPGAGTILSTLAQQAGIPLGQLGAMRADALGALAKQAGVPAELAGQVSRLAAGGGLQQLSQLAQLAGVSLDKLDTLPTAQLVQLAQRAGLNVNVVQQLGTVNRAAQLMGGRNGGSFFSGVRKAASRAASAPSAYDGVPAGLRAARDRRMARNLVADPTTRAVGFGIAKLERKIAAAKGLQMLRDKVAQVASDPQIARAVGLSTVVIPGPGSAAKAVETAANLLGRINRGDTSATAAAGRLWTQAQAGNVAAKRALLVLHAVKHAKRQAVPASSLAAAGRAFAARVANRRAFYK